MTDYAGRATTPFKNSDIILRQFFVKNISDDLRGNYT